MGSASRTLLGGIGVPAGIASSGGVHSAAGSVLVRGPGNRMNRRALVSVVLGCLLVPMLAGCTRTVQGRVVGRTSGEPMVGALVTISGESTRTDTAGAFLLTGIGGETVKGAVVASGFPEVAFDVDLSRGDANSVVQIADAVVEVSLKEAAIEPRDVTTATVTLGGRLVTPGQPLTNVAPGTHALVVQATDHEPYSAEVNIAPGQDAVVATLSLTPLATYERFWEAGKFHHDRVAFKYIHPDEHKNLSTKKLSITLSAAEWLAGVTDREYLTVQWGAVKMYATWKSPITHKTYTDVAAIERTETYQVSDWHYTDYGKVYTDNATQFWAKLNGIWYLLHSTMDMANQITVWNR